MKLNRFPYAWRLTALLLIAVMLLAACARATEEPASTAEPTVVPTEVPAPTPEPAVTKVIQDFETAATPYDVSGATASLGDVAYNGAVSLKSASTEGEWHTVGVNLSSGPVDVSQYGQLCFFVYDTTANNNGKAANTVGVKLYDATGASVERYTDNEGVGDNRKTKTNEWVDMCMNLVSFTEIDQTKVEKIEFTMYWAGDYYFDDITLVAKGDELAVKEMPKPAGPEVAYTFQDFEAEDTYYTDYQAEVSLDTEVFHGGKSSFKAFSTEGEWHAFGAYPATRPLDLSAASKVCFWINDTTTNNDGKADNTVGVKLFDASGANQEVWTDAEGTSNGKTVTGEFVQMCLPTELFDQVDLKSIDKIQFAMFWAGTYYVDDIEFFAPGAAGAEKPVVVADFESGEAFYPDYQADVSLDTEVFKNGKSSLKSVSTEGEWHAWGAYPTPQPFDASAATKLCFWINDTTTNNDGKADNTVGVKLFDASGANQEVWTDAEGTSNGKTVTGEFVQMCLPTELYDQIDLKTVDKIQFAMFWAGTYYVDDIEFFVMTAAATEPALVADFESGEAFYPDYQAEVSLDTAVFKNGKSSLKSVSTEGEWHAWGAFPAPQPFDASGYSTLCFWLNDTTTNNDGKADNTVGVKLFDASGANQEVWSDAEGTSNGKTVTGEFVQMCIPTELYDQIDLTAVDKIQFAMFWAGTYYIDDIEFLP